MTAALMPRPAKRTGSRMQVAAMWLFVLPLFTEGVAEDVVKTEIAGLAVLAFVRIVVSDRVVPQRAVERIFMTVAVLTLIGIAYLAFRPWPSSPCCSSRRSCSSGLFGLGPRWHSGSGWYRPWSAD